MNRVRVLSLIIAALVTQAVFSQDGNEGNLVSFVPESTIVEKGRNFTIALVLERTDPNGVKVRENGIPEGIRIIRGPYVRSYEDDATRISYILRADRTGAFRFDPFLLSVADREISTASIAISAGLASGNELYIPINPKWRAGKTQAYLGETIPVYLEFRDSRTIDLVDDVSAPAPNSGVFEEAPHLGRVTEQRIGSVVLYQVPVTAFVYTPARAGNSVIPSATVTVGEQKAKSGSLTISVIPLPAEVASTGAVGQFRVVNNVSTNEAATGEEVTLTTVISGRGNLGYLRVPDPEVNGMIELDRVESQNISIGAEGYEGNQSTAYRYVAQELGQAQVAFPQFSWIDPETDIIRSLPQREFKIDIITSGETPDKKDLIELPIPLVSSAEIVSIRSVKLSEVLWMYALMLPGPIGAGIVWLVARRRRKRHSAPEAYVAVLSLILLIGLGAVVPSLNVDDLDRSFDDFYNGEYLAAAVGYASAAVLIPGNPALRQNLSLSLFMTGDVGWGIHEARIAVRLRPSSSRLRTMLAWMERSAGVDKGIPPAGPIDPDYALIALIISVNAVALFAIMARLARKSGTTIGLILSIALLVSSSVLLVSINADLSTERGVIAAGEATMRKIPDDRANGWRTLTAGTSVAVQGNSGDFILVQTGFGLKGWITRDRVLLDSDGEPWTKEDNGASE